MLSDDRTYDEMYDDSAHEANPPHLDGVSDMSSLIYLDAPNILHNLECRYKKDEIYTSISKVLIAINPFKSVDIYGEEVIQKYRDAASDIKRRLRTELAPHVFTVSQTSHFQLLKSNSNQSMVVCGESGSGKTESAKHLMRYLASNSAGDGEDHARRSSTMSIEKQVLDANPILESFGNAKTLLNNNSSRFGKFTKIVFGDDQTKIVGSFIETYLLEKSRVTKQDSGERNYHVFYMLCRGMQQLDPEWKEQMNLNPNPSHYNYLGGGDGCVTVDGMSDEEKFDELMTAFATLGFTQEEKRGVLNCVASVLTFGNVEIVPDSKDNASPEDPALVQTIADLFRIDAAQLTERICTRKIQIGKELITKPLSVEDGIVNRDAIAKALYHGVFLFVVSRINQQLYEEEARREELKWVGILDIFGFESFEYNSFEQFCINYANERLQSYFNGYIIRNEQEEYIAEAILWVPIEIPNNQDYIDLLENRPYGILAILDSSCQGPKGTAESFIQNLFQTFKYHARMKQVRRIRKRGVSGIVPINGFEIKHYAGKVIYNAEDFLKKNADAPSDENIALFGSSTCPVTSKLLAKPEEKKQQDDGGRGRRRKKKGGFVSTGNFFSQQLKLLMTTLQATTPYFVRCVKPNALKKPGMFDWKYIRPQLECGGIIEALRILKCGYPTRCTYDEIFDRYGSILNPTPPDLNKRDFCEAILRNAGETLERSEFQLGLTKVFFRPGKQEFMESLLHGPGLDETTIMKIKRFMLNKRFQRARGAVQAHTAFQLILRKMQAERRAKRLFKTVRGVAGTFVHSLMVVRKQISCTRMQAAIRAQLAQAEMMKKKKACLAVSQFFQYNTSRKRFSKKINELIKIRIAKQTEAERLAKEKREVERQAERRRQAEEKEKARLEALRAKKAAEDEKKKEKENAAKKEQEEREARERALAQREEEIRQREKEAAEVGNQKMEQIMLEMAAKEKELLEREALFMKQRKQLALEGNKELISGPGSDSMAKRLLDGATFNCGDNSPDTTPIGLDSVFIKVNEVGTLCWYASEQAANQDQDDAEFDLESVPSRNRTVTTIEKRDDSGLKGSLPLINVEKIRKPKEDGDVCFFLIYSADGKIVLDLQTLEADTRDEWVTAMNYAVRNVRELGTVSRPPQDLARGNILAARLTDRISKMKETAQDHLMMLKLYGCDVDALDDSEEMGSRQERRRMSQGSFNLEGLSDSEKVRALMAQNGTLQKYVGDLKGQLDIHMQEATAAKENANKAEIKSRRTRKSVVQVGKAFLDTNQERLQELERENLRLKSSKAYVSDKAMYYSEKMKIEELDMENKRLRKERNLLDDKCAELETKIEVLKLGARASANKDKKPEEVEAIVKKVKKARQSVSRAESEVTQTEKRLKKKQDQIQQAMLLVSQKEKDLQTTNNTMEVLGLDIHDTSKLTDETAVRLAHLRTEQKEAQDKAKAMLLSQYEGMIREAELLNAKNDELATKNAMYNQQQTMQDDVLGRVKGNARRRINVPGRGKGAGSGGDGKDDGCVIS